MKMYKGKEVIDAERSQVDLMKEVGWSLEDPTGKALTKQEEANPKPPVADAKTADAKDADAKDADAKTDAGANGLKKKQFGKE